MSGSSTNDASSSMTDETPKSAPSTTSTDERKQPTKHRLYHCHQFAAKIFENLSLYSMKTMKIRDNVEDCQAVEFGDFQNPMGMYWWGVETSPV